MKKTSYILLLIASVFMSLAATSCDDYLDVNKNEDAPDYVDGYLYLAGIEQEYFGIYYDLRAAGPLTQMMGTSSYTNFANHYFTSGSDAAGELWRLVYWNQGMNLENMINQSVEAENWTLAGIGYAIKAYSWDMLTKYHGDVPMKQAFVPGLLSHEYDYQEDIYPQVREWAETAIEYLQKEDATGYGNKISSNDYIYGGDKDKWIKFAYAIIVRQLASLTNKKDFQSKYYQDLVDAASKSFTSNADNAVVKIAGGGSTAAYSEYNNFWGVYRGNLAQSYFPHEYAVEVMTGTVPKYTEDGNWIECAAGTDARLRYELAEKQIICDTLEEVGHFDPRPLAKLSTMSGYDLEKNETDPAKLRKYIFFGGTFTGRSSSFLNNSKYDPRGQEDANVPAYYNIPSSVTISSTTSGNGRWLYHDNAPYILTTYAEVLFDLAEAQFKAGHKSEAFVTWKKAVAADMEFTASYLVAGTPVKDSKGVITSHIGDIVDKAVFTSMANEYLNGPYVTGLSEADFSLSHIMMQKFVALYPWGALEAWVDQRKYLYDIDFKGEYPTLNDGWTKDVVNQKTDDNPTKVFKGFYLAPANVQGRRSAYTRYNLGSPCFRVRPRYNSEYMWNKSNLGALAPISGMSLRYGTSMPWFAYPGDQPKEQIWTEKDD